MRVAFLVALFITVFTFSVYFAVWGPRVLQPTHTGEDSTSIIELDEHDETFPNAAHIRTAGDFIAVPHRDVLEPIAGKDFFLFSWVKLRRIPKDEEEVIFLAKIDGESGSARGYSVGIVRKGSVVRPTVYWRNAEGVGGRVSFF